MEVSQRIAVSGMLAHQRQLEVLANNVANVNTTAFKRASVGLSDVGYQASLTAPVGPGGSDVRITGVGEGVQVADIRHIFSPGVIQATGNPLDIALDGDGFLEVGLGDGSVGYTRDGSLRPDADGRLVTLAGLPLHADTGADITVPQAAVAVRVEPDGQVFATLEDASEQGLGRLGLVRFVNNAGLVASGQNIWLATNASGPGMPIGVGDATAPGVMSGAREGSNVEIADELTRMMQAQRGYQLNLRLVQAWDEVARMANELRRS